MKRQMMSLFMGSLLLASVGCDGGGDGEENSNIVNSAAALPSDFGLVTEENSSGSIVANSGQEAGFVTEIFTKINNYRATVNGGLIPLLEDSTMNNLARQHNIYMADQAAIARAGGNTGILISHDNFQSRADQIFGLGYNFVGENVAANRGYASNLVTDTFVSGWISSTGHRANIENDFTHTGIDVYVDVRDNTIYATQLFARLP